MRIACLGKYDALHRGHAANVAAIQQAGDEPILVTFSGMAEVLGWPPRPIMCCCAERAMILDAWGTKELILPFASVKDMDMQTFLHYLRDEHQIDGVRIGEDFRGGKDRHASAADVAELAREANMQAEITLLRFAADHQRFSSTRTRAALADGDIQSVTSFLGRYHANRGIVARGDQRGRTIGFPTANVGGIQGLLPQPGVYAALAHFLDETTDPIPAMVNIGTQPTVGADRSLRVEANLIDWTGDAYDRPMRLAWVRRLRGEVAFDGLDALTSQLREDRGAALSIIEAIPDIEIDDLDWPQGLPH